VDAKADSQHATHAFELQLAFADGGPHDLYSVDTHGGVTRIVRHRNARPYHGNPAECYVDEDGYVVYFARCYLTADAARNALRRRTKAHVRQLVEEIPRLLAFLDTIDDILIEDTTK
jgi:hypothetical protein